ncbi:MAG TPA: hypothetical protein VII52_03065, partial [Gemmatimonadaceae bacterium]
RRQLVPVSAYDRAGRLVAVPRPRVEWVSGDTIAVSADGSVRCTRRGDAMIRVMAAGLSTRAALYCRPMRGFSFANRNYNLYVGGPPQRLEVTGHGIDGRPVTLLAARVGVRDSLVASVVNGGIVPKGAGTTTIDVEAGDDRTTLSVQVVQLARSTAALRPNEIFVEPLALRRNDVRSYPIPVGRFEIRFIPDSTSPPAPAGILLAAANANCARYRDGEPHLSCVAAGGASIVAGAAQTTPARQIISGRLVVRRLSESPNGLDYWFDAASYPVARGRTR